MGAAIVDAIESGLGVIESLATEFLNGFNKLIWNPTGGTNSTGALTTLGTFAFVILGVAVSFSVIRLVMSLVRSNTGM